MPKEMALKYYFMIGWSYLVEILLAVFVCIFLKIVVGSIALDGFVYRSARDWATLEGVLLAVSLVIWGIYFNLMTSEFGGYLRWDGGERIFRTAFTYAVFVQLVSACLMIIVANLPASGRPPAPSVKFDLLIQSSFLVLLVALINIRTLFGNTIVIIRLYRKFQQEVRK